MENTYRHPGCSPSRWHSTACHLGTACQRTEGRWDWHNLTRLLGWTAPPRLHPVHCEVPHNLMVLWPASLYVMIRKGYSYWCGADQRRWCKNSRQRDWKKEQRVTKFKTHTLVVSLNKLHGKYVLLKGTVHAKIKHIAPSEGQKRWKNQIQHWQSREEKFLFSEGLYLN